MFSSVTGGGAINVGLSLNETDFSNDGLKRLFFNEDLSEPDCWFFDRIDSVDAWLLDVEAIYDPSA